MISMATIALLLGVSSPLQISQDDALRAFLKKRNAVLRWTCDKVEGLGVQKRDSRKGRAMVTGDSWFIYRENSPAALNLTDGSSRKVVSPEGGTILGTGHGRIYYRLPSGEAVCMDAQSGKKLWTSEKFRWGRNGFAKGILWIQSATRKVYIVLPGSGRKYEATWVPGPGCVLAVSKDRILTFGFKRISGSGTTLLNCVDSTTGKILWQDSTHSWGISFSSKSGSILYRQPSSDGKTHMVLRKWTSTRVNKSVELEDSWTGSLEGKILYGSSRKFKLRLMRFPRGKPVNYDLSSGSSIRAIHLSRRYLSFIDSNHDFVVFHAKSLKFSWRFPACEKVLACGEAFVVLQGKTGTVYGMDLKSGKELWRKDTLSMHNTTSIFFLRGVLFWGRHLLNPRTGKRLISTSCTFFRHDSGDLFSFDSSGRLRRWSFSGMKGVRKN